MAKQYMVVKVQHNMKGPGKTGTYDGSILSTVSEGGAKRSDFIFKSRKAGDQGSVVAELAAGDTVELKIVKNGDFYNLDRSDDAITLVAKGNGEVPKFGAMPTASTPSPAKVGGGYTEAPDRQASIQRQNALTNAVSLVTAMVSQEMFKKTTKIEILVDEILKVANKFDGYNSGTTQIEALTSTVPNVTPPKDDDPFNADQLPD